MKIRIRFAFALYMLIIGMIDGARMALSLLLALLVHEAGHLAAGWLFHEPFERIELTPFGGQIVYKTSRSASKGIRGVVIAAAGPLANYALMVFLPRLGFFRALEDGMRNALLMTNASMLLINLLPVLPLDGGRIVLSIGYYLFPVAALIDVLTALGAFTGLSLLILAAYGAYALGTLNVSLVIAGAYMLHCCREQREILLTGNIYAVIQERKSRGESKPTAVRFFCAHEDTPLIDVLEMICRSGKSACLFESGEGVRVIGEEELLRVMLEAPNSTFSEAFAEQKYTKTERIGRKNALSS